MDAGAWELERIEHELHVGASAAQNGERPANIRTVVFDKVTGFTAAHSLTLSLSVTGLVRVPIEPVEAPAPLGPPPNPSSQTGSLHLAGGAGFEKSP